jgi:hypothetical protein
LSEQDGMLFAKNPKETKNMDIMTAGRVHVEKKLGVLGGKCQIKFRLGLKKIRLFNGDRFYKWKPKG